MGRMYAWATPEYLLDHMSIEQIFLYYNNGFKYEKQKDQILIYKLSYLLAGKPEPPEPSENNELDESAFERCHPELKETGVVKK